jgi:hypothetical protein
LSSLNNFEININIQVEFINGLKILIIQKVGIRISYADRWFPTTSPDHSAKKKIGISEGRGVTNVRPNK